MGKNGREDSLMIRLVRTVESEQSGEEIEDFVLHLLEAGSGLGEFPEPGLCSSMSGNEKGL